MADIGVQALDQRAIKAPDLFCVCVREPLRSQTLLERCLVCQTRGLGFCLPVGKLDIKLAVYVRELYSLPTVCLCLRQRQPAAGAAASKLRLEQLLLPAADLNRIVNANLRKLLQGDVIDARKHLHDGRTHGADLVAQRLDTLCHLLVCCHDRLLGTAFRCWD